MERFISLRMMRESPTSPTRSESPLKTPKPEVTRYGPVKNAEIKFGSEERFQWQNSKSTNDVAY